MPPRKRFIAGAICPACQALDSLVMWRENKVDFVECVKCKHQMSKSDENPPATADNARGRVIAIFPPD